MVASAEFRFDADGHHYFDARGRRVPSITQLIQDEGLMETAFYTDEGRDRGSAVHDLCRDVDLGVQDGLPADSPYLGYLAAYRAMSAILRPSWAGVEVAYFHPGLRFGGRPDRHGSVDQAQTLLEIKSGAPHKSIGIQLALQAILMEGQTGLPAKHWQRMSVRLRDTGGFKVHTYPGAWEIEEAYRIVRRHCR